LSTQGFKLSGSW